MGQTYALIGGLFLLIVGLVVMYGREKKKVGEGDLEVIVNAAKVKKKLEDGIEINKRMSVRDKLKWLREWARKGEV